MTPGPDSDRQEAPRLNQMVFRERRNVRNRPTARRDQEPTGSTGSENAHSREWRDTESRNAEGERCWLVGRWEWCGPYGTSRLDDLQPRRPWFEAVVVHESWRAGWCGAGGDEPTRYQWFEYRRPFAGPTPYRNSENLPPGGLTKWSSAASVASPLQRRVRPPPRSAPTTRLRAAQAAGTPGPDWSARGERD